MEYEKMLKKAYEGLPEKSLTKERFELPEVDSIIQGNKTVIRNFEKIIKIINRDCSHISKFLSKETATAAVPQEDKLILKGKFSSEKLQRIFEDYLKRFVLCKECGKPDTKIKEYKGIKMLKCEACGALFPIKE